MKVYGKTKPGPVPTRKEKDPNTVSARATTNKDSAARVSAGDPARPDVKKDGIKIRGTGAATKGIKARGPMA